MFDKLLACMRWQFHNAAISCNTISCVCNICLFTLLAPKSINYTNNLQSIHEIFVYTRSSYNFFDVKCFIDFIS